MNLSNVVSVSSVTILITELGISYANKKGAHGTVF
jgi:hypothetical protein